jgi:hypothetical protein
MSGSRDGSPLIHRWMWFKCGPFEKADPNMEAVLKLVIEWPNPDQSRLGITSTSLMSTSKTLRQTYASKIKNYYTSCGKNGYLKSKKPDLQWF